MDLPDQGNNAPSFGLRALILVGVLLWVIVDLSIFLLLPDWSTRGQFGDMFGAINALFSGLALAGVIYAVFLQRAQIAIQERDLRLNARLNALAALIAAYTERARYFDSRASPSAHEVAQCEERIKQIAAELEELHKSHAAKNA